jgi:DNA-directed RNA polymerase specialized sigma24 family protein
MGVQGGVSVDPEIRVLCVEHLTVKQIEVWTRIVENGWSIRQTASHLDLARTTVTDRFDAACRTLRRHGVRFTQDGTPYLEETA